MFSCNVSACRDFLALPRSPSHPSSLSICCLLSWSTARPATRPRRLNSSDLDRQICVSMCTYRMYVWTHVRCWCCCEFLIVSAWRAIHVFSSLTSLWPVPYDVLIDMFFLCACYRFLLLSWPLVNGGHSTPVHPSPLRADLSWLWQCLFNMRWFDLRNDHVAFCFNPATLLFFLLLKFTEWPFLCVDPYRAHMYWHQGGQTTCGTQGKEFSYFVRRGPAGATKLVIDFMGQ